MCSASQAFAAGSANGESEGEFLKADGIAGVLRVNAVDGVVHVIDVDAFVLVFHADHVLIEFSRRVKYAQEVAFWPALTNSL